MSIFEAIISGIVQGITEFLPMSSSGHLVLLHSYFRISDPDIFFDILLHVATLFALLIYFRKNIVSLLKGEDKHMIFYIAIGTLPAIIFALFFEDKISAFFADKEKTAYMFLITSLMLFAANHNMNIKEDRRDNLNIVDSIIIGISQAIALFPGISRSGSTISLGILRGINGQKAFTFSFLLSIPAIILAALYKVVFKISDGTIMNVNLGLYLTGMAFAFVVGLVSLSFLYKLVINRKFYIFGIYCALLGLYEIIF